MKALRTMFGIEARLSIRDMNLIIFALAMPLAFAVIFGILMKGTAVAGAPYTQFQQSFGAIAAISICATGFMGLPLTLSDYRQKKLLRRYQVTPVSPGLLLLVQFSINTAYCLLSLLLVYGVGALMFGYRMIGNPMWFVLSFLLVLCSIFSIGLLVASLSPNSKTTNLVCSLLYFPMLLFSGATLPYELMPRVMQRMVDIFPLTQGIKLLKAASLGLPVENLLVPLLVLSGITILCTGLSIRYFRWE